ncbi:MAG: EamA family transporter, partial [Candidatus Saccharimonadales bacterium]
LFTILLSVIFLSTNFKSSQIAAMIGIVAGAVILAYKRNHKKLPLHQLHKQTILALIAAIVWGIGFFILNPVVNKVSWQSISIISELFAMVFSAVLICATYGRQTLPAIKESLNYKLPLITGIVGEVGMIVFYLGSTKAGSVVIPTVLSAGGPLVASVWAAIIDKEKLGLSKRIGAFAVVAGIVVLNAT